jgi:hypothetical protein
MMRAIPFIIALTIVIELVKEHQEQKEHHEHSL